MANKGEIIQFVFNYENLYLNTSPTIFNYEDSYSNTSIESSNFHNIGRTIIDYPHPLAEYKFELMHFFHYWNCFRSM